jgi:hypothetical protein
LNDGQEASLIVAKENGNVFYHVVMLVNSTIVSLVAEVGQAFFDAH